MICNGHIFWSMYFSEIKVNSGKHIMSVGTKFLTASGEGYNAEFKVSVPSQVKELTEEVSAFANAAGGIVLIGVNYTNQIISVTIDNTKRSAI